MRRMQSKKRARMMQRWKSQSEGEERGEGGGRRRGRGRCNRGTVTRRKAVCARSRR